MEIEEILSVQGNNPFFLEQSQQIPIIIGVTGHRDLREQGLPELKCKISQLFDGLNKDYPNTPLVVLSPLAEGADRLVADTAIEMGMDLVVVLPMEKCLYEEDFSVESKREFAGFISKAKHVFELPLLKGNTKENIAIQGEHRNLQYAYGGAFVAQHCQILIALWDGENSDLQGGTAQTVRFKLEGIPEQFDPVKTVLNQVENGPVYHIISPRVSNPTPNGKPFEVIERLPKYRTNDQQLEEDTKQIFHFFEKFNSEIKHQKMQLVKLIHKRQSLLIPEAHLNKLPESPKRIMSRFLIVDALSLRFSQRSNRSALSLFLLPFIAILISQVITSGKFTYWLFFIYVAIFLIAKVSHKIAKRREYENKHQYFRALAEGLRIQFYWKLAGIEMAASDFYLRKQRNELEGIWVALRNWSLIDGTYPVEREQSTQVISNESLEWVKKYWIVKQRDWFNRKANKERKRRERFESLSAVFSFVALLLFFFIAFESFFNISKLLWDHYVLFLIGVVPVISAFLDAFAEKKAFALQSKRYEWMETLFAQAHNEIDYWLDTYPERVSQIIFELGKEALIENGEWVLLHREKPFKVQGML